MVGSGLHFLEAVQLPIGDPADPPFQLVLGGGGAPLHALFGDVPRDYTDSGYSSGRRCFGQNVMNYAIVKVSSDVGVRVEYYQLNEETPDPDDIEHQGTYAFTTTRGK